MRRLPAFGIAFVFLAGFVVAGPVMADPITCNTGSLAVGGAIARLNVSGDGFSTGGHDRAVDSFLPRSVENGMFSMNRDVTLYALVHSKVRGNGAFHVTRGDDDRGHSRVPFQMTGTDQHAGSKPSRGDLLFTGNFSGNGAAGLDFSAVHDFSGAPEEFSGGHPQDNSGGNFGGAASVVTPEPASLLLLGSGLALAAFRARRRTRAAARG